MESKMINQVTLDLGTVKNVTLHIQDMMMC
jgi:hypothetical protein